MRINIEIGDIEAFIELTETNSFAKAAASLNLSVLVCQRRLFQCLAETTIYEHNPEV